MDCTDNQSVQAYLDEREKLNNHLLQEEIYWKQRAKLFWLREGDENSIFFHFSAPDRKRANRVELLFDNAGFRVEDHEEMCGVVHDYFNMLFYRKIEQYGWTWRSIELLLQSKTGC